MELEFLGESPKIHFLALCQTMIIMDFLDMF